MTIVMDKEIIFANIDEWKEFCKYANTHLEWSNPLHKDKPFEAWQFYDYRQKTVWITEKIKEIVLHDYLFIGIKGNKVFVFAQRTPTEQELEELSFNAEDFI